MAKYKSIIRLQGKVGELVFKHRDGKGIVGMDASIDKNRIENDPAFERTRENNREFGGSAKAAKAVRDALNKVFKPFADKTASGRLLKTLRIMLNNGPGVRGKRLLDIQAQAPLLKGFELNETDSLASKFNALFTTAVNADRNELTLTIPDFHTVDDVTAPSYATHIRFVGAVGTLSNHALDTVSGKYAATNPVQSKIGTVARSAEIQIGGMVGGVTTVVVQLPNAPVLDPDVALIGALGIEFLEEVNGDFYVLATGNAMQIVEVA